MKLILSKLFILCISILLVNTPSFAEDSYENLQWQEGPKTQNILGVATFFLDKDYVALNVKETDKYLILSNNRAIGIRSFFGPNDSLWDGYFSFDKVGYVKDDESIDEDDLLKQTISNQKIANEYRREQGWNTLKVVGWEYFPNYDDINNRLEWAFLLLDEQTESEIVNYETRILGKNGVIKVVLVTDPGNLNLAVTELKNTLSTFEFNPGEKYSEYKQGDRVAEFGLAALIAGGAAAVASKKGLWALLMGLLIAAKKFAFVIIIGLFAGIASLFKRKK